ncbi:MAG: tRNA guanosine(34) transglycosylase Tgt [Candidatus Omnitrophica bacterium CG07_land_8_20_14_0_80_50_8]|nr:MAG: tRNA guanosine(34) transglycosylase Tgt [Candidatus Omnitrophica bacterium CG07_land_8_20_14_0_80_50_8]
MKLRTNARTSFRGETLAAGKSHLTPPLGTTFGGGAFRVCHKCPKTRARSGVLRTAHGDIRTPVFMPVGTQATVKTITNQELLDAGAQVVLSNTYHLYLRPGEKLIQEAGGLHRFMSWQKPILTDSGGFQIFSLSTLIKIKNEGVEFQSHIDGSRHFLTPEDVVRIQQSFGSDILMPLDECVKYPSEKSVIEKSSVLTREWAQKSKAARLHGRTTFGGGLLFGIVQGGTYPDLRKRAARELLDIDFPGYSIGGLSVGEPNELMYEILNETLPELPQDKPRYLMGVGMPMDLFEAVSQGVDMFDCVVPTRNGRNATVFTSTGKLLMRGSSYIRDFRPIDEHCPCYTCRTYSRAYIRHLFNAEEYLAGRLASLHNLTFFIQLLDSMRHAIEVDRFLEFRREFELKFNSKGMNHE